MGRGATGALPHTPLGRIPFGRSDRADETPHFSPPPGKRAKQKIRWLIRLIVIYVCFRFPLLILAGEYDISPVPYWDGLHLYQQSNPSATWDFATDTDHDGYPDQLEYACLSNPFLSNSTPSTEGWTGTYAWYDGSAAGIAIYLPSGVTVNDLDPDNSFFFIVAGDHFGATTEVPGAGYSLYDLIYEAQENDGEDTALILGFDTDSEISTQSSQTTANGIVFLARLVYWQYGDWHVQKIAFWDPPYCAYQPITFTLTSATANAAPNGAPNTRTDVGIGETATLTVSNFSDIDAYNGSGVSPISDGMGTITWSTSPSNLASIVSSQGNSATVRFAKVNSTGSVVVTATVDDAGTYSDDPPATRSITFQTRVPENMNFVGDIELLDPFKSLTPYAQGQKIGTRHYFALQAPPTSVSLNGLQIQENIAHQVWPFPNPHYEPQETGPRTVGPVPLDSQNMCSDLVGWPDPLPKDVLLQNGQYVSTNQMEIIRMEFLTDSGTWELFGINVQNRTLHADGTTTIDENYGPPVGPDGPWL